MLRTHLTGGASSPPAPSVPLPPSGGPDEWGAADFFVRDTEPLRAFGPARVARAGGSEDIFTLRIEEIIVPERYSCDDRFNFLERDADQRFHVTAASRREAMSILAAEQQGLLRGPVRRGRPGIDFVDGDQYPIDVKTFPSKTSNPRYVFDAPRFARLLETQLALSFAIELGSPHYYMTILLDCSYMTPVDHAALWRELRAIGLSAEAQRRLIEVNINDG